VKVAFAELVRHGLNLALAAERIVLFGRLHERWPAEARRILVHRTGNIGDTVVAVPALLAIKDRYRSGRLTLLTAAGGAGAPSAEETLEGTGIVDECIRYDAGQLRAAKERVRLARSLASRRFDLFVGLSSAGGGGRVWALFRDMLFSRMAGCDCATGFRLVSLPQRWARLHGFSRGELLPEFRRLLALVPGGQDFWARACFRWPGLAGRRREAWQLLTRHGVSCGQALVVVHPGGKLPLKRWMADRFGLLARHVAGAYGVAVVLTGGSSERELCEQVGRFVPVERRVNLAGETTVPELVGVLACARAVVSNDTSARHLAAAVGTPCLALVSGRDHPAKWTPIGDKQVQLSAPVRCSPCFRSQCKSRQCLRGVSVADAVAAFDRLWRRYVIPTGCGKG